MPPSPTQASARSLTIGDVLYILFRHKWKILIIFALGLAGAAAVKLFMPVPYKSSAKLFIRYVHEAPSPTQVEGDDGRVRTPDSRGENIINTELEILTSLDLARQAAEAVGPEKILAPFEGGAEVYPAAGILRANLTAENPRRSNVILLSLQHPDREVAQEALARLISAYLNRHEEIHRGVGVFDKFLMQETDQLRAKLNETESELRRAKTNAGIISLEESRRALGAEIAQVRESLLAAETELAERRAVLDQLARTVPAQATPVGATNAPAAGTNLVAAPSSDTLQEYRRLAALIETLHTEEQVLLRTYTPSNSLVQTVRRQIEQNAQVRRQLEADHPGLLAPGVVPVTPVAAGAQGPAPVDPQTAVNTELVRVSGIESRIKILNAQLQRLRQETAVVEEAEGPIAELQRRKELQEAQYKYFSSMLEKTRINEALGPGRVSNISQIQTPSPPVRDQMPVYKVMAGVLFGSLALALGLAFVLEMYLDRSVKRPGDIEGKLGLPLFISIPLLARNGKALALPPASKRLLAERSVGGGTDAQSTTSSLDQNSQLSTLNPQLETSLQPLALSSPIPPVYSDALRDRLMTWFEVKNLTHKPKLVALTSCREGSGVSTLAAGLAASLSETGEGNVLLVDMNQQHGAAHQFHRGNLALGIEDALELEKRSDARVQEHLYVVSEAGRAGRAHSPSAPDSEAAGRARSPSAPDSEVPGGRAHSPSAPDCQPAPAQLPGVLPKRFKSLVPRLKASDYDYIIFDMPPVSQVSLTPRLARFMDMVLVVVESEQTDKDIVKRATTMLTETQSEVGIVLNKTRTYVPKSLQQEL